MLSLTQIISFLALAPVYFPVFAYCPFRLPYLYCLICPNPCLWSRIRGVVLLLALGLNIKQDFFCKLICPFGTLQIMLSKFSPKKIAAAHFFRGLQYIVLAMLLVIIITTAKGQLLGGNLLKNLFLAIFLGSIIFSLFNYRFFCYHLCPVRALSSIGQGIKKALTRLS